MLRSDIARHDLGEPEQKAAARDAVAKRLAEVTDPVLVREYTRLAAQWIGIEVSSPGFCRGWLSGVDEVVDGLWCRFDRRVLCFVLRRWDVADLAVNPAVVEPVDVLGDGDLDFADPAQPPRGRMTGLRMHSALNSELNASAIALSYESPLEPTDVTASASASRSV